MQHGDIQGHMHLRQRARRPHSVRHAYPSSNRFIRTIDSVMYIVGIIGPLVSIPQLIEVYGRHNVTGISVSTWIGYTVLTALWLLYGLVHHEKPIITTQILWLIVNVAIVIGAVMYR